MVCPENVLPPPPPPPTILEKEILISDEVLSANAILHPPPPNLSLFATAPRGNPIHMYSTLGFTLYACGMTFGSQSSNINFRLGQQVSNIVPQSYML